MGQQLRSGWDERDQDIAELEAELDYAYQIISHLQQEKYQLQKQVIYLQNASKQQSTLPLRKQGSGSRSKNPDRKPKQGSARARRVIYKRRFSKWSPLKFAAVAIAVAAVSTSVGLTLAFAVKNLINSFPAEPSVKPSVAVSQPLNSSSGSSVSPSSSYPLSGQGNLELVYNVTKPPNLKPSDKLQTIVNDVVSLAEAKKLPIEPLSMTLIDVNNNKIASYKQDKQSYPASVVKMFWMVIVSAQMEKGSFPDKAAFDDDLNMMIKKSDNNAASRIFDKITDTQSKLQLTGKEYQTWLNKRQQVNRFFEEAGYKGINISQKNYPIATLQIQEPEGIDLKMRGQYPQQPIRNQVTTYHAARLMYEIFTGQAVSQEASKKMSELLRRDVRAEVWKKQPPNPVEFNPVESFFGESLPAGVKFASKAGLTSDSRAEAAFVATQDGKTAYILVVFADDPAYTSDNKIFPEMSRLVYRRMTRRSSNR